MTNEQIAYRLHTRVQEEMRKLLVQWEPMRKMKVGDLNQIAVYASNIAVRELHILFAAEEDKA